MVCRNLQIMRNRKGYFVKVPCRTCIVCRKRRAAEISYFCQMQQQFYYKLNQSCSFNCLTYSPVNLPIGSKGQPTLCAEHLKHFFMRFRYYLDKLPNKPSSWKYIACGEYGDTDHLPHYHFIAFGLSPALTDYLARKAWVTKKSGKDSRRHVIRHITGIIDCRPLTSGGISYVADYSMKSVNGKLAEQLYDDTGRERPFMHHSSNLGTYIFNDYTPEQFEQNNFSLSLKGKPFPIPKYYRDYYNLDPEDKFDPNPYIDKARIPLVHTSLTPDQFAEVQSAAFEKEQVLSSRQELRPALTSRPASGFDYDLSGVVRDIIDPIPF